MDTYLKASPTFLLKDYVEMTKPGICALALVMTLFGYGMAKDPSLPIWDLHLVWSMLGIALVGAASGVLNQYIERDLDLQMDRTKDRPLPAGRIAPGHALIFGATLAFSGEIILVFMTNQVTAILAALTLFLYLAVYTPSKRMSTLSTLIGALPGAMPPLLGWTAATGRLGFEGWVLFAILFIWQIPHFLAIGWLYRDDYSKANFPILTVVDSEGKITVKQIILYTVILIPLTLMAGFSGISGIYYTMGAGLLGLFFLIEGVKMIWDRSRTQARRLFFASIIYLPLLGLLMVWDRL